MRSSSRAYGRAARLFPTRGAGQSAGVPTRHSRGFAGRGRRASRERTLVSARPVLLILHPPGSPSLVSPPSSPVGACIMAHTGCVEFLKWALPTLELRWAGFLRVRRQVCRRLSRRIQELRLADVSAYRYYLSTHPEEWLVLDHLCSIPISRFFRDRIVFEALSRDILPTLAASAIEHNAARLLCWCAGCASGEEPYSLSILWETQVRDRFPELRFVITATDSNPHLLERARAGRYRRSSVREVPSALQERAFTRHNQDVVLRPEFRERIQFALQDIRDTIPTGPFDIITCRNLVFTYFDASLQRRTLERILASLRRGGALLIGLKEHLPDGQELDDWAAELGIYRHGVRGAAVPAGEPEARQRPPSWN